MSLEVLAWVVIPVAIFMVGVIAGSVKGIIRFAQYLAHTEESLDKVVASNVEIRDEVRGYKSTTDERFDVVNEKVHGLDRRLFSIEKALG